MLKRVVLAALLCGSLALASTVTVRSGDTLGSLAARYDTSVSELMRLNGLRTPNISVGQTLRLPSSARITVQPGDTLEALAARHDTTAAALRSANGLSGDRLRPGQTLRLPGSATATPTNPASAAPTISSSGVYTVRAGDTLEGIAKRLGTSVDALKAANGLTTDRLRLEQRLRVPGSAPSATAKPSPTAKRPASSSAKPVASAAKPAAAKPTGSSAKPTAKSAPVVVAPKPSAQPSTTAKPVAATAKPSASKPMTAPKPVVSSTQAKPATITVQRGDTLYSIARRSGKSVTELRALNNLTSDALTPGQTLRLSSAPVATAKPAPSSPAPAVKPSASVAAQPVVVTPPIALDESAARPAPTAPSDMLEMEQEFTIIEPLNPPATVNRNERLLWPVSGILTSRFGYRWGRLHTGLDIAVPSGTAVYAALSGTVQFAGWNRFGYGYLVIIRGVDNRDYYYAHNSRLLVQRGQFVNQGRIISRSGSTGNSTGPHLHFEVRIGGVARNPIAYLPSSQVLQARYAGK